MNVCAHKGQKASELPGARVTGISVTEVGAEDQTWVLWEISACSSLLRHLSTPHLLVSTSMTVSGLFSQRSLLLNTWLIFFLLLATTCGWKWIIKVYPRVANHNVCQSSVGFYFYYILFTACVYVPAAGHVSGQRVSNYGSLYSPSTVWVSGIKLRLSPLVASVHCATSPVL